MNHAIPAKLPARTLWSEWYQHLTDAYTAAAKANVARADRLLHEALVKALRELKGEFHHDGRGWRITFKDQTVLESFEMPQFELDHLLRATGHHRQPMRAAA